MPLPHSLESGVGNELSGLEAGFLVSRPLGTGPHTPISRKGLEIDLESGGRGPTFLRRLENVLPLSVPDSAVSHLHGKQVPHGTLALPHQDPAWYSGSCPDRKLLLFHDALPTE